VTVASGTANYGLYVVAPAGSSGTNYGAYFGGPIGVGSVLGTAAVYVTTPLQYGVYVNVAVTIAASTINTQLALSGTYTSGSASSLYGVLFNPTLAFPSGTTTTTAIAGFYCTPTAFGVSGTVGTVTNYYGTYTKLTLNQNLGTITVANMYGLRIDTPTITSGTVTTQYGVYVDALTGASQNYGAFFGAPVMLFGTDTASHIYIGGTASRTYSIQVNPTLTFAASSSFYQIALLGSYTSVNTAGTLLSFYASPSLSMASGTSSQASLAGFQFNPTIGFPSGNTVAATLSNLYGLIISPSVSGGGSSATMTITQYTGLRIYPIATLTGLSVTTYYGINIIPSSSTAAATQYGMFVGALTGAVTTSYGLYVDTVSGATTSVGIYSASKVGIGVNGPFGMLQVGGVIASSNTGNIFLQSGVVLSTQVNPTSGGTPVNFANTVYITPGFSVASGAITQATGLYIDTVNVGATNNYGLWVAAPSNGVNSNTAAYFGGRVGVQANPPASMLHVVGTIAGSSDGISFQSGVTLNPTIAPTGSGTITNAAAVYIQPAFTRGSLATFSSTVGLYIDAATMSGTASTYAYGMYVALPVSGVANYAAYFSGPVMIGNPDPNTALYITTFKQFGINIVNSGTFASSAVQYGIRVAPVHTGIALSSGYEAIVATPTLFLPNTTTTTYYIGFLSNLALSNVGSSTGTVTNYYHFYASGGSITPGASGTLTIGNYYGFRVDQLTPNTGSAVTVINAISVGPLTTATTTNVYCLKVEAQTAAASSGFYGVYVGTISGASGNNYGLYIDTVSGGSNNFGIFTSSNVMIGGLDASASLYVNIFNQYSVKVVSGGTFSGSANYYGVEVIPTHATGSGTGSYYAFHTAASVSIANGITTPQIVGYYSAPKATNPGSATSIASALYGAYLAPSVVNLGTSLTVTALYGTYASASLNNVAATTLTVGTYYGLNVDAVAVTGTTTVTTQYGVFVSALTSRSTTTTMGVCVQSVSTSTTTQYGVYVGAITSSGTTAYGLYVDTVSGATNSYGAYIASNVGIGSMSTVSSLYVSLLNNNGIRVQASGTMPGAGAINLGVSVASTLTTAVAGAQGFTAFDYSGTTTVISGSPAVSVIGLSVTSIVTAPASTTATLTSYYGVYIFPNIDNPSNTQTTTITTYYGVRVGSMAGGGGAGSKVIGTQYGVKVDALTNFGSTTIYGLYVAAQSGASSNYAIATSGSIFLDTAGGYLSVKTGTNACAGTGAGPLSSGTLTIATTCAKASSVIVIARTTAAGTLGHISYSISAGTSFTITSSSVTDTSTFSWLIVPTA
jgi:hypothetical protein